MELVMIMKKRTMIILIAILSVVFAAACFWYFYFFAHASNPTLPKTTLTIGDNTWSVETASTMMQQALGLSGRDGLNSNDGMLFLFGSPSVQNFWMKDMKFPLDMIWISGDTVAGFAQNVEPQPGAALWKLKIFTSPYNVDKVLEVNAGTVAKDNIKVGDAVRTAP
jgi:uncharacterized membrane protein (UPF0127 family)